METNPNDIAEPIKKSAKPRIRSVAYPSYAIETCIKNVEKINKEFTSVVFTPKEALSTHLQSSGGSLIMLLSSCVQYQLLEIKQKEGYKPSAKFEKINKPMPGENTNDILLECLSAPQLYKKLLAQFKDKPLPSESGLANILDRTYKVKGKASLVAAKVFLKNVSHLSLVTNENVLKIDSVYISFEEQQGDEDNIEDIDEKPPVKKEVKPLVLAQNVNSSREMVKIEPLEIPVVLDGLQRLATIRLPREFSENDIKRISKILGAYLP